MQLKWTKEILDPTHISPSVFERIETVTFPSSDAGYGYTIGSVESTYRGYNISIHDGALPGSNSYFIRMRNESIGIFAIGTDDTYTSAWYNLTMAAILDDLLDLPSASMESVTSGGGGQSTDTASPLPAVGVPPIDPRPAPDSSTYLGKTFSSPAYNDITLSTLDLTDTQSTAELTIPVNFLLTDIATMSSINYGSEVLYANWDQAIGQHLIFTHFDGPIYNVTIFSSWSEVGGDATDFVGKWWGAPTAVITDKGIGFFEGFWGQPGAVGNIPAVEEGVEEKAEAWFVKQ